MIILFILFMGGIKEGINFYEIPRERENITFEVKEFKFKPFLLNSSRNALKIRGNEMIFNTLSLIPSFMKMEYGDIIYSFKERKAKIPEISFYSYCEIEFWNKIYPEIENVKQRIKEISKQPDALTFEKQKEIERIKGEFHEKFLEKRIEVMENLGNQELKEKTYEAYKKYMNFKRKGEEK
ncbi:MAG: hypothetical protein ABIM78_02390 [candidate division WOR-3 bacterium]